MSKGSSVRKALSLEWILFKLSAIADLQVSGNIVIQFINDIIWYLMQIILFESLYLNASNLGGWGVAEMRVFLGMLFFVDAIYMVLFQYNFEVFSEKIARRELDLILLRPVSSMQLMTTQRHQCSFILNAMCALAWLVWSLSLLPGGITWSHLLLSAIVVPAALMALFATRLLVCTFALVLTRAEHFHELYYIFYKVGQRPDRLYGPILRYFILFVFPVAMIASVPATVLIEPANILILMMLLVVSASSILAANKFWNWAVKQYMMKG